jgi:8-oxo-dGTP pyrophosphatase MutT (NUDIX family)
VAFPGGKNDPSDDSLRTTALREAEEELGIPRARVDVLGRLDDCPTITGFTITPLVGWLPHDVAIVPNPSEVQRAFAAPIRTFLEPPSGVPPWRGWSVDGELVWGATAAIIRGFAAIVRDLAIDQ